MKSNILKNTPTHEQVLKMIELTSFIKHKLILSILYGTGIRLEELISIKWIDVERVKGDNPLRIKIHGKGNKDRYVPLSENLYKLLTEYCKELNLKCDTDKHEYVLGGAKPYSMGSVNKVVKKAAERAGVKFKVTPHKLRHAFAMYLHHEMKYDLAQVGKLLGHSHAGTVMIYARMKEDKIVTPI